MSLRPVCASEVPAETVRVAHAVFPQGCLAMRMRDVLGPVFSDVEFSALFSARGQPAVSPGRLALVSLLQFCEGLSDRQAAHAVRARIDWKYALGLGLADPGFDFSVLSEFRARLIEGGLERRVLDAVLEAARAAGLLAAGKRQRSDSTHVLATTRELNRLEFAVETLRAALNAVAAVAGDWLIDHVEPEWFDRYSARPEDTRSPSRWAARVKHGHQVGADGMVLLQAVFAAGAPEWLRHLPAVDFLRQAWIQQYQLEDGQVRWREPKNVPPATIRLTTPYDADARTGAKRETAWDGYKVHLTETCEPDAPHLITHVVTTPASVADMSMTAVIHTGLAERTLLPDEHLVDAGYVDADHLVTAQQRHQVKLVGPVKSDTGWQSKAGAGFDSTMFTVDWDNKHVTCPTGKISTQWRQDRSQAGIPVIRARFHPADCRACPVREKCTKTGGHSGRRITLRLQAEHEALRQARLEQRTPEWQRSYQHRAGIEGTIAQGVSAFGLRRSRYRGLDKTRLQHLLTAAAMNLTRLNAWLTDTPFAPTRTSHFAALRPAA
ncbi:IS1182 family transposase [Saccharopolyspora sp. NPDC050389]|uniref:IS1182 family transposase n=1 Tax=Saccharopolyspora sp. NPDC050389 TaxID=3155516 RepID=UPI0033C842DC